MKESSIFFLGSKVFILEKYSQTYVETTDALAVHT